MYIVFFEYDNDSFFFGVTSGSALTSVSKSRDEVALSLDAMQKREDDEAKVRHQSAPLLDIPHKQGFVRRSYKFIEGTWRLADENEGAMTIFVYSETPAYFVIMKDDWNDVIPVASPEDAASNVEYLASTREFK